MQDTDSEGSLACLKILKEYLHSTRVYGVGKEVVRVDHAGVAAIARLSTWAQFNPKGQEKMLQITTYLANSPA